MVHSHQFFSPEPYWLHHPIHRSLPDCLHLPYLIPDIPGICLPAVPITPAYHSDLLPSYNLPFLYLLHKHILYNIFLSPPMCHTKKMSHLPVYVHVLPNCETKHCHHRIVPPHYYFSHIMTDYLLNSVPLLLFFLPYQEYIIFLILKHRMPQYCFLFLLNLLEESVSLILFYSDAQRTLCF